MSTSVAAPSVPIRPTLALEELYYIEAPIPNRGPCRQWWQRGGARTPDLLQARKFSKAEALALASPYYIPWPCSKAEALVQWHVVGGGGE